MISRKLFSSDLSPFSYIATDIYTILRLRSVCQILKMIRDNLVL